MSNIVKIETLNALEKAVDMGLVASDLKGRFEKTFAIAEAVGEIRNLLTPEVMKPIMNLQGTKIGFKTDKQYPIEVVRECLIESVMQGVYPVGNEWNIIAGNAYITKEGMGRKLSQISGLSYSITPDVPHMANGGAIVKMKVEWTYNGKSDSRELPICTRVNSMMGADAIIGKATRKARAWLWQHITGQEIPDGDASEIINVTPDLATEKTNDNLKDQIKKKLGKDAHSEAKSNGYQPKHEEAAQ